MLRGHVGDSAHGGARGCEHFFHGGCRHRRYADTFGVWSELRKAEIQNLGVPSFSHEYIGGFDVPVDDAPFVCGIERIGHLNSQLQHSLERKRISFDEMFESLAIEEFHHNEVLPLMLADLVNRADIGMVQRGCGAGFPSEPFHRVRVFGEFFRQELQGHGTAQVHVLGLVHYAHTSSTEFLKDAVMRDRLANHGGENHLFLAILGGT